LLLCYSPGTEREKHSDRERQRQNLLRSLYRSLNSGLVVVWRPICRALGKRKLRDRTRAGREAGRHAGRQGMAVSYRLDQATRQGSRVGRSRHARALSTYSVGTPQSRLPPHLLVFVLGIGLIRTPYRPGPGTGRRRSRTAFRGPACTAHIATTSFPQTHSQTDLATMATSSRSPTRHPALCPASSCPLR